MNRESPGAVSTTANKISEFRELVRKQPSPKCYEGSISKQLGHLSVIQKQGQMSTAEISKTKEEILK